MSIMELEEIRWDELDREFGDSSGDFIDITPASYTGSPEGKPNGHEPYPTQHLVGKFATEDVVNEVEERWHAGQRLSPAEQDLLALAGEDLRSDFYR